MSDDEDPAAAPAHHDGDGTPLDGLAPWARAAVVGAGLVLAAIVAAAQRDVATQAADRLRGPRWLWKVIASTPPGVVVYGLIGTKKPMSPYPDLPAPTVALEAR